MQERKNKILVSTLLGLLLLISLAFWRNSASETRFVSENVFLLDDYTEINSARLTSPEGQIELKYNGTRWVVNERHDADRNMISVFFATLQQARPKRMAAESLRDSLKRTLMETGTRVSLFAGQSLLQEFYVGGNPAKTQAYFFDPKTESAYLMEIPGYRVYVSGIFELDESGWRDKYVFNFNWRNFRDMEIRFPRTPHENFKVVSKKSFFGIEDIEADTSKLNTFLDAVSLLTVDQYLEKSELLDSLSNASPTMEIIVSDIANRTYPLKLFGPSAGKVAGLIRENEGAYFNPARIQPIIRPKSFFKKR